MKKEVKKLILLLTILLLFVTIEGRMETQAAMNQQADKNVPYMALLGFEKISESNAKICAFDDRAILASGLVNSNRLILNKKNTPTPTPASKQSSEEEDEYEYDFGYFIVIVIIAVLYLWSRKKKNTIYVKRK